MAKTPVRSFWLGFTFVATVAIAVAVLVYVGIQIIRPAPVDYFRSAPPPASSEQVQPSASPEDVRIPVAAMGDMIADDTVISSAQTASGDYDFAQFFNRIRSSYADAKLVFCNQEGPSAATTGNARGYPDFNAPPAFSAGLSSGAGCNAIGLASNRIGSAGQKAIDTTLDQWDALSPLLVSGANRSADEQSTTRVTTIDGVRIALVSFTQFNANHAIKAFGVNLYNDDALLKRLVADARANADFVMVSMHWGRDDIEEVTQDQRNYAAKLAAMGVDVVIGTGPHILQTAQWLPGSDGHQTLVWYSLGNMLSAADDLTELIGGIAHWDFVKKLDGTLVIENASLTPTYLHYDWPEAARKKGTLSARSNVDIYLLADAGDVLPQTWPNSVVDGEMSLARLRVGNAFVPLTQ